MDRTKQFAAPAGHTIVGIPDGGFSTLGVHAKDILGTNGKTDPAPGTAFPVQFIDGHE
jgi:hypothetical protein